jgi:hypothetical protein
VATPNTILAWHRQFVDQTCDGTPQRQAPGRPKVGADVEALVVRMAQENRSWGYDRIVGALSNLGGCPRISVSSSLNPGLAWCSRAQRGRCP